MSSFSTTKDQLNITVDEVNQRINLTTSALLPFISTDEIGLMTFTLTDPQQLDDFERLKNVLIMHRQHASFLILLLKSMSKTKADIDHCLKGFKEQIESIHEIVKFRTTIPTEKIFVSYFTIFKSTRLKTFRFILASF